MEFIQTLKKKQRNQSALSKVAEAHRRVCDKWYRFEMCFRDVESFVFSDENLKSNCSVLPAELAGLVAGVWTGGLVSFQG